PEWPPAATQPPEKPSKPKNKPERKADQADLPKPSPNVSGIGKEPAPGEIAPLPDRPAATAPPSTRPSESKTKPDQKPEQANIPKVQPNVSGKVSKPSK